MTTKREAFLARVKEVEAEAEPLLKEIMAAIDRHQISYPALMFGAAKTLGMAAASGADTVRDAHVSVQSNSWIIYDTIAACFAAMEAAPPRRN